MCIRDRINAAEPVDAAVIDAFERFFGAKHGLRKGVVFPTYGLAESTVLVCGNGVARCRIDADSLRERRCVSSEEGVALVGCGAPRGDRDVTVKIVRINDDDQGEEVLGENCVGEIWVRSPSIARGYWGVEDPSFGASIDGESGYLRTGDEGFFRDGELYVCGRRKDLVILRGKNHYPQDLEATWERAARATFRPGCSAVVSLGKDRVQIVCEARKNCPDLADACSVARNAVQKAHGIAIGKATVVSQRELIKTSSGKVARRACRDALAQDAFTVLYTSEVSEKNTCEKALSPAERARLRATLLSLIHI